MNSHHGIYCISPETGINIDAQGFITTCCASTKYPIAHMDDDIDWNNFFQSPLWLGTKAEVQSGESTKLCNSCQHKESLGLVSRRTSLINTYSKLSLPHNYTYLDIDMGNTCNLWCPQCESKFSSKWFSIDKDRSLHNIGRRTVYKPFSLSRYHVDEVIGKIYKNITRCQLKGGEPFASKNFDYFVNFLLDKNCQRIDIITNGTILNDKHIELLGKFQQVNISVSIDGIDEIGNWIRYAGTSSWSTVEDNIKRFMSMPNAVGDFLICTMVYNFFSFDKILEKLDSIIPIDSKWKIIPKQIVQYPEILNVNKIVPMQLRLETIDKVKHFHQNKKIKFFNQWINYISRPDEVDLELLENFHTYTKKLNSLKNSNIYKHLPRELQCIN